MKHICIVIPCYNEEQKWAKNEYTQFLSTHSDAAICFVNDGSSDGTLLELQALESAFPQQVQVLDLPKNQGKAEAVRQGVNTVCQQDDVGLIAFLDADLAVSLEECYELSSYLASYDFCFGSRILRVGAKIERKFSRFMIGRIVATIISRILDLKVYDTQCGCKLFKKELASRLFEQPFISKWLFDVELFFRMYEVYGKEKSIPKMIEIPLEKWIDKGDSKVKTSYFFKLFSDLYRIRKTYKHTLSN